MTDEERDDLSPLVKAFIGEVESLCRRWSLQIAVSGHDTIQIWNLDAGEEPIYSQGLLDKTGTRDELSRNAAT